MNYNQKLMNQGENQMGRKKQNQPEQETEKKPEQETEKQPEQLTENQPEQETVNNQEERTLEEKVSSLKLIYNEQATQPEKVKRKYTKRQKQETETTVSTINTGEIETDFLPVIDFALGYLDNRLPSKIDHSRQEAELITKPLAKVFVKYLPGLNSSMPEFMLVTGIAMYLIPRMQKEKKMEEKKEPPVNGEKENVLQ